VATLGAALGALARAGLSAALPHPAGGFPTATLLTNLLGCAVMGALAPVLGRRHPLVSLGCLTGVLGGFTTYSTFAVDAGLLSGADHDRLAVAYAVATLAGCVVSALTALSVSTWAVERRR
jgi:CrcB protein